MRNETTLAPASDPRLNRPRWHRWGGFVLALLLALGLTACGDDGDDDEAAQAPPTNTLTIVNGEQTPPPASGTGGATTESTPRQGATAEMPASPAGTPAATLTPTATATPVTVPGATIGAVVWATEVDPATQAPITEVAEIPEDVPTIYAALPLVSVDAGTVISVQWIYNDVEIAGMTASVTTAAAAQNVWVTFRFDRSADEPWPVGTYRVIVSVNGTPAQEATIEVVRSN